jgi:hypothetical protein
MVVLINNQVTNVGTFANNALGTTIPLYAYFNRIRDATNSYTSFGGSSIGDTVSDTDDATEYVSQANNDYRLTSVSAAKGAGIPPYLDCGALQRAEPTLPAVRDVEANSPSYGDADDPLDGEFQVPGEEIVKTGEGYGYNNEFVGEYVGGGAGAGGVNVLGSGVVG